MDNANGISKNVQTAKTEQSYPKALKAEDSKIPTKAKDKSDPTKVDRFEPHKPTKKQIEANR